MPIYEYKCPKCNKKTERFLKVIPKQIPIFKCDDCKIFSKHIPSKSSFILKGQGFYVNDYKKD